MIFFLISCSFYRAFKGTKEGTPNHLIQKPKAQPDGQINVHSSGGTDLICTVPMAVIGRTIRALFRASMMDKL